MRRISRYITLLSLPFYCTVLFAQEEIEGEEKQPLYQGILVAVDAFSAVMSAVDADLYSFEAAVHVDLLEKFFPAFEMGVAGADRVSINDYGFKTAGVFFRLGADYNLLKPNPENARIHRYLLVGLRYAFSPFTYDVTNVSVDNGYWGDDFVRNYIGVKTVQHWMEVVGGLHVEVVNNFYMGWGIRWKIRLSQDADGEISPWYIPGIGIKSIGNAGFNYTIGYKF